MFNPTHNKKYFCKYVKAKDLIKILSTLTVRWSSPDSFNDPFDTKQDFNPSDEDIIEITYDIHKRRIFQEEEPNFRNMDYVNATKLKLLRSNKNKLKLEEWYKELQKNCDEIVSSFQRWLEDLNQAWQICCADDRIFCVAEDFDNLLMWSHYAEYHKGAVIKLKCIPELDTALCAAMPITYSDKMPVWAMIEEWSTNPQLNPTQIVLKAFYTKSKNWSYEKEWRLRLKKQAGGNKDYDLNRIHKEEIEAVYLGCKMCDDDRKNILELRDNKLKHVKVFQADKNRIHFKLDFIQIR